MTARLRTTTDRHPEADSFTESASLSREFAQSSIVVERDLDSAELVLEQRDGYQWIIAYSSYEVLEAVRGHHRGLGEYEGIDHATMTGRTLREQARARGCGVIYRRSRDDEDIVVAWPPQATVSRVAIQ